MERGSERVRVREEIIRVDPRIAPRPAVRTARTGNARLAAARPAAALRPVASRTHRFFFGDGRYRPEPFPRPVQP
jgi:hypothetical protein